MVRTKADVRRAPRPPTKAVAGKASRKITANPPIRKSKKGKSHSGGSRARLRKTPQWQKPITNFIDGSSTSEATTSDVPSLLEESDVSPELLKESGDDQENQQPSAERDVGEESDETD